MSESVDLTTLKTLVGVYEKELVSARRNLADVPEPSGNSANAAALAASKTAASVKIVEICGKLIDSYREYTKELEKLVQDNKSPPKAA